MNEEIRNRNNELNEAVLEQVSGGTSEGSLTQARKICEACLARSATKGSSLHCEGGVEQLAEYIESERFISHWQQCPCLKKP